MSIVDLDLAGWAALGDRDARLLAERIAAATDTRLALLLPYAYRGRPIRLALFSRGDVLYSLVPGGEVTVGFDAGRFAPPAALAAGYSRDVAAAKLAARELDDGLDDLGDSDGAADLDWPGLTELVAERTTPARTVVVPPLLAAVQAQEAGVREYDDVVTELARHGERLPTPDEWEYLCGAGASTLWRWGNDFPPDASPLHWHGGPHQQPNLFALTIGNDPYRAERTAERTVLCGGDGGTTLHGGSGIGLADWLTVATAFRDPEYGDFVVEHGDKAHWVRPVIPL